MYLSQFILDQILPTTRKPAMKTIYICQDLEKCVIGWLAKAYANRIFVELYTEDIEKWDLILWEKHHFLPHSTTPHNKFNHILLKPAPPVAHTTAKKAIIIEGPNSMLTTGTYFISDKNYNPAYDPQFNKIYTQDGSKWHFRQAGQKTL